MSMGISRRAGALALILLAAAALTAAAGASEPAPKVVARSDRSPDPGGNFTLTFTVTSYQTANYTILVSPRPEFAFADLSNGSQKMPVQNGTSADFSFEMQVGRSARQGTYAMSYSVLREGATVKMGTVDVTVGSAGSCSGFVVLLPVTGLAVGLAWARRPGR
jgi:hypothetical protein